MVIERDNDNIVITLNASLVDINDVQKFADYFRLIESNAQNKGTQVQADKVARESQKGWWQENRSRFIK